MPTTIRPINPQDLEECVSLGLEAFQPVHLSMERRYGKDLFDRLRPDWEAAQAALIRYLWCADDKHSAVAVTNGTVSGFIVVTANEATGLASIDTIAVRPTEQRSGLGALLVEHSVIGLRRSGMAFAQVYLRDFPGHEPARRLLEQAGFASMPMQPMPLYLKLGDGEPATHNHETIRAITEADVSECVRFGLESFRPVYASFKQQHGEQVFPRMFPNWEITQAEYIESVCGSTDHETFAYDLDGTVSGFVVLAADDQLLGEIELLAVDPAKQGNGVGTALNQFAIDRLTETGMAYAIVATADDPGHAAARRSYAKVGFIPMPIQWNFMIADL